MTACEIPSVDNGDMVVTDNGYQAETRCYEGYFMADGDSLRICYSQNSSWSGVTPLCLLTPGMSSTTIMLLIGGPIVLFFALCFLVDFYFYKRRKQFMREQQGMIYYRELRRVGMCRAASLGGSFDVIAPPVSRISSVRRHMMRFRSLIKFLATRRNSDPGKLEKDEQQTPQQTELVKSVSLESGLDTIPEGESENSTVVIQVYEQHSHHEPQQQHGPVDIQEEQYKDDTETRHKTGEQHFKSETKINIKEKVVNKEDILNQNVEERQHFQIRLPSLESRQSSVPRKNHLVLQVPVCEHLINDIPASKPPLPNILQIQVAEVRRQSYGVKRQSGIHITSPTNL